MLIRPSLPRASCFIDGQNLYFAAREAFGLAVPDFDPRALSELICRQQGWQLRAVHFYTGIPSEQDDPFWCHYWRSRMAVMGTRGVHTCARPLKYHRHEVVTADGNRQWVRIGREKGIDVRLALDVVRTARDGTSDVIVIFSQDQDLGEVALEIRAIAAQQARWIKIASAFPVGPGTRNARGIDRTDWLRIDPYEYDTCRDPRDYRGPR